MLKIYGLIIVFLLYMIEINNGKDWNEVLKTYDAHLVKVISKSNSKYKCVVSRFGYLFRVNLWRIGQFKWNFRNVLDESKHDFINNIILKDTVFKVHK